MSRLVARGLTTTEIAAALRLSPHTVRDYVKQVFERVGVSSRRDVPGPLGRTTGDEASAVALHRRR